MPDAERRCTACHMLDVLEMSDPVLALRPRVEAAVRDAFGSEADAVDLALRRSTHADYQADVALALARRLRKDPRQVATSIVDRLPADDVIGAAAVSGPGFINLTLRDDFVTAELGRMLADDRLGVTSVAHLPRVLIDYSSPNLAKEMHVGHLRSTIIGDSLARIYEFLGHEVVRQNHIGDWGTPFGMLIEHMLDDHTAGSGASVQELSAFYRQARAKFDSEPGFADRARRRVVLLQSGDGPTLVLWRQLIELTLRHLDALYAKLDVKLTRADVVGESRFNDDLPTVAAELKAQGLAHVSDGAVCVFPPGFVGREGEPLPLIVQKKDGGFGYGATDLAAIRFRVGQLRAEKLFYVVGAPQHQYLSMVFAVAKIAGWLGSVRAEHVAFGSVLGADKKVLKTRAGESVSLESLLDGAVERARALVDAKSPELGEDERAAIAKAVGIGAVKYADLANQRTNDYIFDENRMLAFEGNTGPYLMYAHARIRSILRKVAEEGLAEPAKDIALTGATERALGLELLQFPAALTTAAEGLYPHRLCQYLYDLATAFSGFYQTTPVLRAEGDTRGSRIALCVLTAQVLRRGLDLVGIQAPMRM